MILGNLFEITFSISFLCIAKTLSEKLWGFRLLSASDALVPRACRHFLATQNIELPCKWCGEKTHRGNNTSKRWWWEGTWRHQRNLETIKKPEWTGNTDNAEEKRYPSQGMDGNLCMFFPASVKMVCLHLRVLSPVFHCNQQRNFS